MNAVSTKAFPRPATRILAAALMLLLWLGLGLVSSSSSLHHFLHQDSHQTSHECVVTLLSKGLLAGPEWAALASVAPIDQVWVATADTSSSAPSSDVRLSPGRAPPGALVFSPASS